MVKVRASGNLAASGEATARTRERNMAETRRWGVLIVVGWTSIVMRMARISGGGMENREEVAAKARCELSAERAAASARSMYVKRGEGYN